MNNRDWTEELRERMDSFSEAAPEGLWDAISRKRAARRRAAWWYGAGGLLAAAAIAALALLPRASSPAVPAAEVRMAEAVTPAETPLPAEEEAPALAERLSEVKAPVQAQMQAGVKVPVQATAQSEEGAPAAAVRDQAPMAPESSAATEVVAPVPDESSASAPEEPAPAPEEPAPVPEELAPAAESVVPATESVVPAETTVPLRRTRRARPASVQVRISSGSYLAQAAGGTTTGYGLPDFPGVKAAPATKASGWSSSGVAQMLSRNKASTTTSHHTQSARLAFLVRYDTGTRWGVETGLTRTTLQSAFDTESGIKTSHTDRTLHYTGIPLFASFRAMEWKKISGYLSAGPMYEFCTGGSNVTSNFISGESVSSSTTPVSYADHKWSLNINAGVELGFGKNSAVFVQPGFAWYLPDGSGLESFYTEHPAAFNVTFGYRLRLF